MGYDWDAHKQTCYRLYIEEGKALEDIMHHMRVTHKFTPSKRAFQSQFRKWNFPFKQKPAYKNDHLVHRIRQLWEANQPQGEMLRILQAEGFDIKSRELMRVRMRNRWLLRVPNRDDSSASPPNDVARLHGGGGVGIGVAGGMGVGVDTHIQGGYGGLEQRFPIIYNNTLPHSVASLQLPILDPEAKVLERQKQLENESADRWATKKRRRRTRDYAGLPADPPGPPRFPSETTLAESQRILDLDKEMYQTLRTRFKEICEEEDVLKKTAAGQVKWDAVKDRLVKESEHLTAIMAAPAAAADEDDGDDSETEERGEGTPEAKKLALDVLCTDVTKRMRMSDKRMTIADAKNILGVNPEQSRQIRAEFYNILKNSRFTMKLEAGIELWGELKQIWLDGSPLLQRILASGPHQDPNHNEKVKAVEALARDVMKRLRDDQTRRKPTKRKSDASAPMLDVEDLDHGSPLDADIAAAQGLAAAAAAAVGDYGSQMSLMPTTPNEQMQMQLQPSPQHLSDHHSPQIHHTRPGPGLLPPTVMDGVVMEQHQAAAAAALLDSQLNSSMLLTPDAHAQASFEAEQQHLLQQFGQTPIYTTHHHTVAVPPPPPQQQTPIPVYIRLHHASTYIGPESLWIETLRSARIGEIHAALEAKYPDALCVCLEGLLKDSGGGGAPGGRGTELRMQITSDEELGAFVAGAMRQGSPNPTLVVLLAWRGDGFQ